MSSSINNISLFNNINTATYNKIVKSSNIDWNNNSIDFKDNLGSLQSDQAKIEVINENFKWLEVELLKNDRKMTALDFLKIDGYFGDSIQNNATSLMNNHALICTGTNKLFDADLVTGDLIYKTNTGEIKPITLGLSGIYIPEIEALGENSGGFKLKWTWYNGKPVEEPKGIILQKAENTNYYGLIRMRSDTLNTPWKCSFSEVRNCLPVIKGYNKEKEEVFWDINLTLNSGTYYINNIPNYIEQIVVK